MILSALRTQLARWLQDEYNVQWPVARLDRAINLALRETEKHILGVDPEAFKCTYIANTVVPATGKDSLYSYPVGTFAVHEIALSSDGVNYAKIKNRISLNTARRAAAGEIGSLTGYIPYDAKHFMLWPPTSTAVTSGLRIIVAPTLVIADDIGKSPLPPAFETLNLKHAQLFALWDVGEPTETVQKEVEKLKEETPKFYLTDTTPPFVEPLVSRY